MSVNGLACEVCNEHFGYSPFWWPLHVKFWWHEVRGGKDHREAKAKWYEENAWRFK